MILFQKDKEKNYIHLNQMNTYMNLKSTGMFETAESCKA